jgi:hypothetical protein
MTMISDKRILFLKFNKSRNSIKLHPTMTDEYKRHMLDRLYKALGILQHCEYFVAEKEQYHPDRYHCNCNDQKYWHSQKRDYKGPCKHRLAIAMLETKLEYRQLSF